MLQQVDPAILYFGTPVVLVSSVNEDGSANLAPMSSAWWLGNRCMLGFGARSKTPQNIIRTGECVLNLPSETMVAFVDRLALTTGSNPVPPHKAEKGYRHVKDKFSLSGLTAISSASVAAPRVLECPVQMEATLVKVHALEQDDPQRHGTLLGLEVRVTRVYIDDRIRMKDHENRIDPDLWRPLIQQGVPPALPGTGVSTFIFKRRRPELTPDR